MGLPRAGWAFDGPVGIDVLSRAQRGWVIAAAALVPVLACWLLSLVLDVVVNTTAALGLVVLVVLAAATGIRVAGVVAGLSASAGFDYFLTEPYLAFSIAEPADLETAVLLFVVGAAVSEIAVWRRRQQARASREQGYPDGVMSTARSVAAGHASTGELIDLVRDQILVLLGVNSVGFDPAFRLGLPCITDDGTLLRDRSTIELARRGRPTDTRIALPSRCGGRVDGHFALTASTGVIRPGPEQPEAAEMLADQVGAALAGVTAHRDA